MQNYTLIAGVNGTGKSSLTGILKVEKRDLGEIINVKQIAADRGISNFAAGKIAIKIIDECLRNGFAFTQETTLAGHKTSRTIRQAKAQNFRTRLFYTAVNTVEECWRRIDNRVANGGHWIAREDVARRFAGRWTSLAEILPWCDEAFFFDNENGFTLVEEYRNGEIPAINSSPKWLRELQNFWRARF